MSTTSTLPSKTKAEWIPFGACINIAKRRCRIGRKKMMRLLKSMGADEKPCVGKWVPPDGGRARYNRADLYKLLQISDE